MNISVIIGCLITVSCNRYCQNYLKGLDNWQIFVKLYAKRTMCSQTQNVSKFDVTIVGDFSPKIKTIKRITDLSDEILTTAATIQLSGIHKTSDKTMTVPTMLARINITESTKKQNNTHESAHVTLISLGLDDQMLTVFRNTNLNVLRPNRATDQVCRQWCFQLYPTIVELYRGSAYDIHPG